jgi:hypothetical protein
VIASLEDLRRAGFRGLRVVGDVHGDSRGSEAAAAGAEAAGLFLVQLGDLTDNGPDSPAVLRTIFALIDAGRGLFLLGNHDHKLRRALMGDAVRVDPKGLGRTGHPRPRHRRDRPRAGLAALRAPVLRPRRLP